MDNDLMSALMGVMSNPETKDKILNIISDLKNEAEEPDTRELTPPMPRQSFSGNDFLPKNSLDIMMKMQNAMERLNRQDDYRIGLLNSIKPFLRNGRERNIDAAIRCIQILNFASGR